MTGYGSSESLEPAVGITVEIRSVNHRYLDVKITAPREYGPWEAEIRRAVASTVGRGRVEVYVGRTAGAGKSNVALRRDVAAAWVKAWKRLKKDFSLSGEVELSLFQGRDDIFRAGDQKRYAKAEIRVVKRLLARALESHHREREREGAHLKRDMEKRLRALSAVRSRIRRRMAGQSRRLRVRLEEKVKDLTGSAVVDRSRLVQETAMLAERADVSEELVRLESHMESLAQLVADGNEVGKRIDFLLQEVNRELNTIASKAGDLDVTRLVVDGKAEVEKLREQVQNVE
jgi:uncharacterized protein (TIGR00255 family)